MGTREHPPGYHRDEDARERCYACNGSGELDITPADEARAKQLLADGFRSTSNKYRLVSRVHVPKAENAFTFSPEVPEWLRKEIMYRYEFMLSVGARKSGNYPEVEQLELTMGEFRAFKKLGGKPW